ncbi:hypothetical protein [Flavihumibacter sp. ZG627]|uniref:hypothetical protein n=1 Tax=Flavihumibacter sp. ZG627 TaxID=1463156 RepID=UPI00057CC942|nr:hypothetical protein [Flavihumibacter sp. ZG627]KIC92288.1 hypothetical protein HY58_01710 [Flavihumibacter sp. ZG627]
MAICNNPIMSGMRGRVGNLVFKRRGNKTIVCAAPKTKSKNRKPTIQESIRQDAFYKAAKYAGWAMQNPDLKELYATKARKGRTAGNVAFRDAYLPPEINEINASGYLGKAGDMIRIEAIDDFKVISVKVSIHLANGQLLEEGNAVEDISFCYWIYFISIPNNSLRGTTIQVSAEDLAGNITIRSEQIL